MIVQQTHFFYKKFGSNEDNHNIERNQRNFGFDLFPKELMTDASSYTLVMTFKDLLISVSITTPIINPCNGQDKNSIVALGGTPMGFSPFF